MFVTPYAPFTGAALALTFTPASSTDRHNVDDARGGLQHNLVREGDKCYKLALKGDKYPAFAVTSKN